MIATLGGCGGGGGSSPQLPPGNTTISGTASQGIIYPGTINVYAVNASGAKGALLAGSIATEIDGKYVAPLRSYSGAIVVEASGSYTDESTGRTVTIPASKPLHAMVDKVNETTDNNRVVTVSTLTEIAWRTASANGTRATLPAAMTSTNQLVSDLFKVHDILGTEPVRPDNATMANSGTKEQVYTLALAALSEMASTASGATDLDKMETVINRMATEVGAAATSGSMGTTVASDFNAAVANLSLSTDFPDSSEQLAAMGRTSQILTLATTGTLPTGTTIYAINATIVLPADPVSGQHLATIDHELDGQILSDDLALAGGATGSIYGNYLPLQHRVVVSVILSPTGAGLGIGDFAMLSYDLAAGATLTAADFSILAGSATVKDANGAVIPGVSVIIK